MTPFVVAAVVAGSLTLIVAVLTAIGSRRRGAPLPLSLLAGTVFPITWGVWYVHDEHPYHRPHRHFVDRC